LNGYGADDFNEATTFGLVAITCHYRMVLELFPFHSRLELLFIAAITTATRAI
jgi:hypothetical protein